MRGATIQEPERYPSLHTRIIPPAIERSLKWIGETPNVKSTVEEEMLARKLVRKETAIELRSARKRLARLRECPRTTEVLLQPATTPARSGIRTAKKLCLKQPCKSSVEGRHLNGAA